jgi:uncharacterized protein
VRYLYKQIQVDIQKKMVFVGGPRQVGKTTLALEIIPDKSGYLNWDIPEDRERILKNELPPVNFWAIDEIHKHRSWRNYLKGLCDKYRSDKKILVTGSARLDLYRFGGDSLQGRYHYLHMHPLSVSELNIHHREDLLTLIRLGGFPEPFYSGSDVEAKRWSREYRNLIIREEITSLERIHDLGKAELMMLRLPDLVSSPLSINALREDLQVSHKTVSSWLQIMERLYVIFRLLPFGAPKIRAVKKEQKHFHYDWSIIKEEGSRFENMVACHLMKWIHFMQDTEGRDLELRYFRDVDGREVDFVILENQVPFQFVECKWNDQPISKGLKYLGGRFPKVSAWQISAVGQKDYQSKDNIRVCNALTYLKELI